VTPPPIPSVRRKEEFFRTKWGGAGGSGKECTCFGVGLRTKGVIAFAGAGGGARAGCCSPAVAPSREEHIAPRSTSQQGLAGYHGQDEAGKNSREGGLVRGCGLLGSPDQEPLWECRAKGAKGKPPGPGSFREMQGENRLGWEGEVG